MLRAARRSVLTAAATRRSGGSWTPVAFTTRRWLSMSTRSVQSEDHQVAGPTTTNQEPRLKTKTSSPLPVCRGGREERWRHVILPSLEVFAQVHDHCLVPYKFVVPSESPWPPEVWDFKLGFSVHNIRSRGDYQLQTTRDAARLVAMDFVWDVSEYKWRERILPALAAFAKTHGHCDVPYAFVVPSDDLAWPRKAWTLNLGTCVRNIRSQDYFYEQTERDADQLDAIGFVRSSRDHRWSTVMLPALEAFAAEYGHCAVPRSFIVPSKSPWPLETRGLKLGYCVGGIRNNGHYSMQIERDAARLEAIDFVWSPREYQWKHRILPSLEVFHRLEGHAKVPSRFVVPSESPWPESAWGMKLGEAIYSVRRRETYAEFVDRDAAQLTELGVTVEGKRDSSASTGYDKGGDKDVEEWV